MLLVTLAMCILLNQVHLDAFGSYFSFLIRVLNILKAIVGCCRQSVKQTENKSKNKHDIH